MAALEPFATIEQFQAFWRALDASEQTRANSLLSLASNRLRLIGRNVGVDVDVEAQDELYASVLQWVVCEAVKRAMLTPTDQAPVDSYSQTAGPYSENYKYTNPSGDLWFKKSELSDLYLGGEQKLGSISSSRTDIYRS